ncbi:MAG: hypothetical protein K0Q79_2009 [Flavipsychrobacter sp.]|jgi:hypothetical protein|nr:hypothetical protein [Flavipsychrobacter sp.]
MAAPALTGNSFVQKINFFCLIAAIAIVFILPFKKEIWYDETVSMLCSKGISHDTPAQFANDTSISSAQLDRLNNTNDVFRATVNDNANSFLYNYKLHWFTQMLGSSVPIYMLLSKLCAIATLIAFFALSRSLLNNSIFTGIAIILLVSDLNFISMSHEIRAYAMGTMFVTFAALFFYKFIAREKAVYLFLNALFSVCAVLSHFLSVYIIAVFLCVLLIVKGKTLFTVKNIIAILVPASLLGLFFYYAYSGLNVMSSQSRHIEEGYADFGYKTSEVFLRSMKYVAINFKAVMPAFKDNAVIIFVSFLFIPILYYTGIWASTTKTEKRDLHILFALGISSSIFLLVLSLKSHHYTSLYFRYYSFGLPFSTLFVAYLLYVCYNSPKVSGFIKTCLSVLLIIPAFVFFAIGTLKETSVLRYNHPSIAADIARNKVSKIEVPEWQDALLLHTLLPQGYKIDYFRSSEGPYFTLYKTTGVEKIPVIKD